MSLSKTDKQHKTVLVVEDQLDMRFFLKTLLETNGYVPLIAKDGRDGLSKAKTDEPDLIILDVMMLQQGGAVMYQNLKSDDQLQTIPVIMLSAVSRTTFQHFLKMLAAQTDDTIPQPEAYVEKPPDPRNLLQIIQQII